jgi:D-xylose 1-dehydrogenase (NADP+, D-xylono-1,5-lactone-forming)
VRLLRAAFSFDLLGGDRPEDVRLQGGLDGGGLMDVGCYCVSAFRLLAGEPERVSGRQVTGGDGVDVRFTGTMGFPGGVLATFDCGLDMTPRSELEVIGDAGTLHLSDPWHSREARIEVRRPDGTEVVEVAAADPYGCELEDFAAAARGERPHPFGREDAVGQARTIDALYRSAEFGADAVP